MKPVIPINKNGIDLVSTTIFLFITLTILHIGITHQTGLPLLFGDRSDAMFDLWSLQHFAAGILIGSFLYRIPNVANDTRRFIALTLVTALSWEAVELAMEGGAVGLAVTAWKHGYEHSANRLIGDPLLVLFGTLLARKHTSAWKWALILAGLWLIVNVSSPNSMSIQNYLFGP